MARAPRNDEPGAWHHVMNRGLAKRAAFEDRQDARYFKSRIAYAVRRKELEVHAFAILTTHFHLLVRSPRGHMAEGMRRVQNEYVRWFNRRNRRDGPLFRGRFISRRVTGLRYRRILVSYIDRNPASAGATRPPEAYEYGSARHYAQQDGPRWLNRSWVERDCAEQAGQDAFTWESYRRLHGARNVEELDLADLRIRHPSHGGDPLDELVHGAPASVLRWMRRKAALADGSKPGLPCVTASSISTACRRGADSASWTIRAGRRNEVDLWNVLEVGLLRDLSGLRWPDATHPGSLCATLDGFSLHARVQVEAHDRERLEHLCRYVMRPALATLLGRRLPEGRPRLVSTRALRREGSSQ